MLETRSESFKEYQQKPTDDKREIYRKAIQSLSEAYNTAIEEDINVKLRDVEMTHVDAKNALSW